MPAAKEVFNKYVHLHGSVAEDGRTIRAKMRADRDRQSRAAGTRIRSGEAGNLAQQLHSAAKTTP